MLKRFKNMKWNILLLHVVITMAYPLVKTLMAEGNRLLIFSDILTIVAGILLVAGIVYSLALHGDFDIAGYTFRRGFRNAPKETYDAYRKKLKEKREDAFNYPLFVGLLYIAIALFIAYVLY